MLRIFGPYEYRVAQWLFRWETDDEGDITLCVAHIVRFTKYKEHTMVRWGTNRVGKFKKAPKWVRANVA